MGSPVKSAKLRAGVVPSIFVNEQNVSEAPQAQFLKTPQNKILGWLLSGGTTILHTSKPSHGSESDQGGFAAEAVHNVAPGLACELGEAVETSPKPACETNYVTEKSVQVQLLMRHEGCQTDEKKILSTTAMQTEPYTFSSGSLSCASVEQSSSLVSVQGRLHSCEQCTYVTLDKSTMIRHLRKHMGEPPFQCLLCPAAFIHNSKLVAHVRTHTGERPFSCAHCDASFMRKGNLVRHVRMHTGERPFSCVHCNATFSAKATLIRHVRTHTGERPYCCVHCNASFSLNSSLNRHVQTHTGESSYFCVRCKAYFVKKSHLMRHVRIHTGEKPFSCVHCNASFSMKGNLNQHMRTHQGERSFSTPHYNAFFLQKGNVVQHIRMHT